MRAAIAELRHRRLVETRQRQSLMRQALVHKAQQFGYVDAEVELL